MRLMFATVKTAVVVTLFIYISSCMAFETSSSDDVMMTREAPPTLSSLKSHTTDEERVFPAFIGDFVDFFKLRNFEFNPERLERLPEFNYLVTAGYRSLQKEMLANNPGDPLGGTLTWMRRRFGDVAVAKMIVRAESFPETKEESQHLLEKLIHQYADEKKTTANVCDLLEITKSDDVNQALNGPLFNTWAVYAIEWASVLYNRPRGTQYHAASVHLSQSKEQLQGLTKKVEALEYAMSHCDESLYFVVKRNHEYIVKELDEKTKVFERDLINRDKIRKKIKKAIDRAIKNMRIILIKKYAKVPVDAHLSKLRQVMEQQYEEIKVGL